MRAALIALLVLSGCTALPHKYTKVDDGRTVVTAQPASDYLFMNTLCLFFCSSSVTAAASSASGEGNTNTQSPSTSQGIGSP